MRTQGVLLCTFVEAEAGLEKAIDYVKSTYDPQRLFVLSVTDTEDERFALTFNIDESKLKKMNLSDESHGMIRVHRNSSTNTLFTLNALNAIKESGGDNVNWNRHKNSIITTHRGRPRHFHTRLNKIIHN